MINGDKKAHNPYENYKTQADKKLLEGKKGLILGVANEDSIAWHIAMAAHANGANVVITHQARIQRWIDPLVAQLPIESLVCEVTEDQSIADCCSQVGEVDFVVYGPAYANKEDLKGNYLNIKRENFKEALDISCYSLIALLNNLQLKKGGNVLALTYHGSQKVIPCYDLMGIAKAALEANVRYLSYYLGKNAIRVNALSAGPIRTLAASRGIKGYDCLEEFYEKNSPMERNVGVEEVAKSALYLLSDLSSGVTGEVHYVDCGYNIMGVKNPRTSDVDLTSYNS